MPKKNLFDTIESVLKNEKFDDHQRKAILYSLSNCKYSKLKYNQIELNEPVVIFHYLKLFSFRRKHFYLNLFKEIQTIGEKRY